jgi:small-conductance mechanosensitive channel
VVVALAAGLFSVWEVSLTPLLASAGLVGAVVALAAGDALSNVFSGISIFLDRTYQLGDYINLESGERGEVVEIGIRSTQLQTRDDLLIIIPNSVIARSKIVNESAPVPLFRIRLPMTVAYGTDLEAAEAVLTRVAGEQPLVLATPEPRVRYRAFGEAGVQLELLCWCRDPATRGIAVHDLVKAIYRAFAAEGIRLALPQQQVYYSPLDGPAPPFLGD